MSSQKNDKDLLDRSIELLSLPPRRDRTFREKVRDFFLNGIFKSVAARGLLSTMKKRSESPRGLWGNRKDRYDFAVAVGKIIQEEMGWPAPHFYPDDPLRCVLYTLDELIGGLDLESALRTIESVYECDISGYVFDHWDELTYGDFIDYILEVKKEGTSSE